MDNEYCAAMGAAHPVRAAECPGKPGALGTSSTLVIEPTEHTRLGMMQYPETLPLDDHEVVLTFDDGPLPCPEKFSLPNASRRRSSW